MFNHHQERLRNCTNAAGGRGALAALPAMAVALMTASAAHGQAATFAWDNVPVNVDSGPVAAPQDAPDRAQVVFSEVVGSNDADWVRLEFGEVEFAGSLRDGDNAILRITSLEDGAQQTLDAVTIRQWHNTSAYFNGRFVEVELLAYPNTGTSSVEITNVHAGQPSADGMQASICDGSDDRQLSGALPNEPDARMLAPNMESACTGFLIGDRCFLSAGHCSGAMSVIQFNVPLSNSNGSNNHPPPADQYSVDTASIQSEDGGIGDDWMYFGVFDNSETGLSPFDAQGAMYSLADSAPPANDQTLRIRGYGATTGTDAPNEWDNVLTWDNGPYTDQPGTAVQHRVDTTGGNSGSAIYMFSTDEVIGIHSHAGCHSGGGANNGTAIHHANLQDALNNPQGVCATDQSCPGDGNCCEANGTPGCNDATCCELICGDDPFCCETEWDQLCADAAGEQCTACLECGDEGTGDCCEANGTPACDDEACCSQICDEDPFCCETEWDSLCADAANEQCTSCVECGDDNAGDCCEANGSTHCDDEACCSQICDEDPFCCETEWDQLCADAAIDACETCFECGSANTGSCCEANGTTHCNDAACCDTVCADDPFCCETEWDQLCADAATDACDACAADCPEDLTGDGSIGGADLGTLLSAWGPCDNPDDCPEDLTGDGSVGGADLGTLLSAWGDCP